MATGRHQSFCLSLLTPTARAVSLRLCSARRSVSRSRRRTTRASSAGPTRSRRPSSSAIAVQLELKSGRKFLAIYTPNPKAAAGVIVVHGLGLHPDWGLNGHLRTQLADQGYATLSVQMPVLAADAKAEQYPPLFPGSGRAPRGGRRVPARQGHEEGRYRLAQHGRAHGESFPDPRGRSTGGCVGRDRNSGRVRRRRRVSRLRCWISTARRTTPRSSRNAGKRAAAIRTVRGSGQVQVAGADHFFAGHGGRARAAGQAVSRQPRLRLRK